MTEDHPEYQHAGGRGWMWTMLIALPILILLFPAIMGVFNTFAYPGFESCKRKIGDARRDPSNAEYEWPPRRSSHRTDPDIYAYRIEVRSTNAYGGVSTQLFRCIVDSSGSETRYLVEW